MPGSDDHAADDNAAGGRRVHPLIELLAAYGWRVLVLAGVVVGIVWVLGQIWTAVVGLVIAVFLARALHPLHRWFQNRGFPDALAAFASMTTLFAVFGLAGWLIVPSVVDEFRTLGPTLTEAVDDLERWLIEDAPVDLTASDLERYRAEAGESIGDALRSSSGVIVGGALTAIQLLAGILLGLIATFFLLRDGPDFQRWALDHLPAQRRDLVRRLGARAWSTLGGYLAGAAVLGAVESVIIGVTLTVVGGSLALPVAVLTFVAAFVPFVGAIVAGVVAVLVALATTGVQGAVVVAIVAVVVQQLDNDLLAPVIYGQALKLHPLVVLFAIVAGGALFGLAGTILAVPVTALAVNLTAEAREPRASTELGEQSVSG